MWTEIAMQLRTEIVLYVIVRLPIFDRSCCWPDITGRQDELCLLSIFLFLVTLNSSWVDITQHHPIWRPIKSRPVLTADMSRDDGPSCQVMSAHVGERFHVCVRVQRWLFIEICNLSLCITADYTPHSRRLSMRCPRHSKSESTQSHRYLMYIKPNVCVCVCVCVSVVPCVRPHFLADLHEIWHVASVLIPYRWSWGLASAARACGLTLRQTQRIERLSHEGAALVHYINEYHRIWSRSLVRFC